MHNSSAPLGFAVFIGFYALIAWAGFAWARARINRRAREVAALLERAGARVTAQRPTGHLYKPAEFDFELDGQNARLTVRQFGRDTQLIGVTISAPAMPPIWIRRERAFDRVGKTLGLEREVQMGVPDFDAAVYIASSASDEIVREALASAETQRILREVCESKYAVTLSSDGISAATIRFIWADFDALALAPVLRQLKQLAATLPKMSVASTAAPRLAPTLAIIGPAFVSIFVPAVIMASGLRELVHPPVNDAVVLGAILSGLLLWMLTVYLVSRSLRRRPLAIIEVFAVAMGLLASVPFMGAFAMFALNAHLDHGAEVQHHAQVVEFYRRNRHTVWVTPWDAPSGRLKLIVPSDGPVAIGDSIDFESHPGAFGWTWVSNVRRSESSR